MSTFIMKNHQEGEEPIIPPAREDGGSYGYCMFYNNFEEVAFADTPEELVNILIPGYSKSTEEDKDFLKIRLAQTLAAKTQAEILSDVNPENFTEEDWNILTLPKTTAIKQTLIWKNKTPLILVQTSYSPYTAFNPPASTMGQGYNIPNLWWVRPQEEEDFLISLHEIGEIRIMKNLIENIEG